MRLEPSADMRAAAVQIRTMFLALVEQGFTSEEALRFTAIYIAALRSDTSEDN